MQTSNQLFLIPFFPTNIDGMTRVKKVLPQLFILLDIYFNVIRFKTTKYIFLQMETISEMKTSMWQNLELEIQ